MKLTRHESKRFKCDNCGNFEEHKDMYSDAYCYECMDIETGELKVE